MFVSLVTCGSCDTPRRRTHHIRPQTDGSPPAVADGPRAHRSGDGSPWRVNVAQARRVLVQSRNPATGLPAPAAPCRRTGQRRLVSGKAAKRRAQMLIVDVATDPGFTPHRAIAAASDFRAVLSTPLIDWDGRLIGVVSTHYRRPHYSLPRERQVMRRYGDLAARSLARYLTASRMAGLAVGPLL